MGLSEARHSANRGPRRGLSCPFPTARPAPAGSYLGLSAGLEAGAEAGAEAAGAAGAARGGEAGLGEAALGSWAEAGSSGVVAWLVHTGACSIGVLMRRDQERQQVKGPRVAAVVAAEHPGRRAPLVLQTAGPSEGHEPPGPERKGSEHREGQMTAALLCSRARAPCLCFPVFCLSGYRKHGVTEKQPHQPHPASFVSPSSI